jgi:hypothetical protein
MTFASWQRGKGVITIIAAVAILATGKAASVGDSVPTFPPEHDWRAYEVGKPIRTERFRPRKKGYCEGSAGSGFRLRDGRYTAVFTVASREGARDSRLMVLFSEEPDFPEDKTRVWWPEPPGDGPPESNYGSLAYHPDGTLYCVYGYNHQKVTHAPGGASVRGDSFGKAWRFSTDHGRTWSKRHLLKLPDKEIDRENAWKGKVQAMYCGVSFFPRLIAGDDGYGLVVKNNIPTWSNVRGHEYRGELFIIKWPGWRTNSRLHELKPELIPPGDRGITDPNYGFLEDYWFSKFDASGHWVLTYRVPGYRGVAVTRDFGKTWTYDRLRYRPGARHLKNPSGQSGFASDARGQIFFQYHNIHFHDLPNYTGGRDLVYIAHRFMRGGRMCFSQPELFTYRRDQLGFIAWANEHEHAKLNINRVKNEDGSLFCTKRCKDGNVRVHVPQAWFDHLAKQKDLFEPAKAQRIFECGADQVKDLAGTTLPPLPNLKTDTGFTLDYWIRIDGTVPVKAILLSTMKQNQGIEITTGQHRNVIVRISDGNGKVRQNAFYKVLEKDYRSRQYLVGRFSERPDPELFAKKEADIFLVGNRDALSGGGTLHHIVVTVDAVANVAHLIVNGVYQDGGPHRYRTAQYFSRDLADINGAKRPQPPSSEGVTAKALRLYGRPLTTTESIGDYRVGITWAPKLEPGRKTGPDSLALAGRWTREKRNGTPVAATNALAAYATFRTDRAFSVSVEKGPDTGKLDVYIDGKLEATADTYAPAAKRAAVFESRGTGLERRVHLVWSGFKNRASRGYAVRLAHVQVGR